MGDVVRLLAPIQKNSRDRIVMRCPNCQTENPANAKFCLECGNRLVVCPNCGTVNLPVAKFCIECGTPLAAQGASAAPPPARLANESSDGALDTTTGETQEMTTVSAAENQAMLWETSRDKPYSDGNRGRLPLPEERRVVT